MKQHYVSAINKINAPDNLREKTLAAMNAQKSDKKQIAFRLRYAALAAACFLIVLAAPAVLGTLRTKSASPMQAQITAGANKSASERSADGGGFSQAAPKMLTPPQNEAGIRALDIDAAQQIALSGEAFLENAKQAGGYEAEGLEIIKAESLTADNGEAYFKITAKTNTGEEIILTVR